jgi:dienelactone hydrolase
MSNVSALRDSAKRRKWTRRLAVSLAVIAVLIIAVYVGVARYRARDYLSHFRERKGHLVSVAESPPEPHGSGVIHRVTLQSDKGLKVDAVLKIPQGSSPPRAAIIILGGLRSGVHALEYVEDTGDLVVLAMDFPYEGKRSGLSTWEFLRQIPAIRRAVLDTPSATMLGVDYLHRRPEVDRGRVALAGGSLGALFAPAVAAADDRITALALLFGAGDLSTLVDANLPLPGAVRRPGAWIISSLVSPLEPLKYIGRVAPRPVFMLNGTGDARMPERCSRLLHEAAGEPKTIRWIDAGHVHIRDEEFRREVLDVFLAWLSQIGYLTTAREPQPSP